MAVELKVPSLGESITEVIIGDWHKHEGDWVAQDETLVEIESDKATADFPAPVSGTVTKVLKASGETANVGEVIGYMEESSAPPKGAESKQAKPASATAQKDQGAAPTKTQPAKSPATQAPVDKEQPADQDKKYETRVMPAARRELAEKGLKPEEVTPSGPGGRLLKEDVLRHVPATLLSTKGPATSAGREEERVPMSTFRRRIAQRLVEAQQTAALLTTFNEIDMSGVIALRAEHKDAFQEKYNVKLGFMSFFVKATVEALKQIPQVNAEIQGNDIVYRNYYDIGVAVGGGKGLVVPVVRNAERLSFAEIEMAIGDFGRRARDNQLKPEELQGGTFTISNGGIYGSLLSTPIVNPPQSGILGLHAIQERPIALNGQVVIRPMMYIALTYDHRLIDGREAVTFLKRIKEVVEEPARMLLEI